MRQRDAGAAFESLAARFGHIAIAAATTGIARHGQFVLGVGAEQGDVHFDAAGRAPLRAQFVVVADRRLQVERQAGLAIGPVAQLVEGGRFKALAHGSVETQRRVGVEHDAGHGREIAVAGAAAVVGIGAHDVVIHGIEFHVAVPQPGQHRPAVGELPPQLGKLVDVLARDCLHRGAAGPSRPAWCRRSSRSPAGAAAARRHWRRR